MLGSIPAGAGEPTHSPLRRNPTCTRVYPRGRGGTVTRSQTAQFAPTGVYPRGRGGTANCGSHFRQSRRGSIPAGAGEPRSRRSAGKGPTAVGSIPAGAGEPSASGARCLSRDWGLSPRARGNRSSKQPDPKMYAGLGLSPRARGNRGLGSFAHVAGSWGLSPRARGNPRHP